MHVITAAAAGSAGERSLRPSTLRHLLDVVEADLRRLAAIPRSAQVVDDDFSDAEEVGRRVADLRSRLAAG